MRNEKVCPICGAPYETHDRRQKFCSQACSKRHLGRLFRKRVALSCQQCGKAYEQKPCVASISKFCSVDCKNSAKRRKHLKDCVVCGTPIKRVASRLGHTCSYKCLGLSNRKRIGKTCAVCGKAFEAILRDSAATTCSRACRNSWMKRNGESRPCQQCGKSFHAAPSAVAKGGRFCSFRCLRQHKGPNGLERRAYEALRELGIEFVPEHRVGRYRIDCFLPSSKIAIELDGDYWHSLPAQVERDARKNDFLKRAGIEVVRIAESEIDQAASIAQLIASKINPILP